MSRRTKCTTWMTSFGTCSKMKATHRAHLFDGKPINGGTEDVNAPGGFHAYTNGAAPTNITITRTVGNPGKVHKVYWRYTTSSTTVSKMSSMFPRHLSKDQVCGLVLRKYTDWRITAPVGGQDDVCSYDNLSGAMGFPNNPIEMNNPGDTVYPTGHRGG